MKIEYVAEVLKTNGVKEIVTGTINTTCSMTLYGVKCRILTDNFKPGEAVGTDSVSILDPDITFSN